MSKKTGETRNIWKILLLIHTIVYEAFFIYAIDSFKFSSWYTTQQYFIILMIWSLILLLHVGATYHHVGRGDISKLERDAYREGFADAVRQFGSPAEMVERLPLNQRQMALDDEGELVEMPVQVSAAKRKRSTED